jgi:hypothetical protein
MRQIDLVACQPMPSRITTDAAAAAGMSDLVKQDFTVSRPEVRLFGDMTYVHT